MIKLQQTLDFACWMLLNLTLWWLLDHSGHKAAQQDPHLEWAVMIIICSRHNTLQSLLSLQTALTLLQTFMAVNQIKLWLVFINIISCNIWFMCVKVFYQYWTKSVCLMWWWRFHAGRAGMRNTSKIKLFSIYLKRMVFQLFLWVQTVG